MSHPLPATQHRRREKRIVLRLIRQLEVLDIVDHKAPLPAGFAGEARRTLQEAEAVFHGNLLPPAGTRSPGEIFASTMLNLKLVSPRNALARKANSLSSRKVIPVGSGRV
jgi:hypothetical protein